MDPQPVSDQLPTEDGGYQRYKAAGKLEGKKALITGGDSGIGRAIAILYAMEGAESMIVYLPEEEKDAKDTQRLVEKRGGKLHLYSTDLRSVANCTKVVETALEKMGRVNILVNNAGYQMMQKSIRDISEYVISSIDRSFSLPWRTQRAMDPHLSNQRRRHVLPLETHPAAPPEWRHDHQLRLHQRLHWPSGPARLHRHQRCHCLLYPCSLQSSRG